MMEGGEVSIAEQEREGEDKKRDKEVLGGRPVF